MRDDTGIAPWLDEGPVYVRPRATRVLTSWEDTPNATELPVPGDPTSCTKEPADYWFSKAGTPNALYAAKLCKFCWMVKDCREYGLKHPEEQGIWGGLTYQQRQQAKSQARRKRAA